MLERWTVRGAPSPALACSSADRPRCLATIRPGLGTQLILLVLCASLLSGGLVGWASIETGRKTLHDEIATSQLATADLAAAFASRYVLSVETSILELASRPTLREVLASGDPILAEPAFAHLLQIEPRIESIAVFTVDGTRLLISARDAPAPAANPSDREWFQAARNTGERYLGTPVRSRATGRPIAPLAVPLYDHTGTMRRILLGGISLATLSDALTTIHIGTSARISLLDSRDGGVIVANTDPTRILQPAPGVNGAARRLFAGERGVEDTINSRGEAMLAAFAPVPELPWGILIQQPKAVAFQPLDGMAQDARLITLLVILATGALGIGMAIRITRPIRRLGAAAVALANGDLTQRTGISAHNELGDLGRAFDQMAASLEERSDQLCRAVADREALLRRREALLRVARELATSGDPEQLLDLLVREAIAVLDADHGVLSRWDEPLHALIPVRNTLPTAAEYTTVAPGQGVAGRAIVQNRPLIVNDYQRTCGSETPGGKAGVRAAVAVPLVHEGRLLGALGVNTLDPARTFTQQDAEMLETLGSIGSAVLHNLDLAERLRWLADTDALTGLANRQKAQSVLEHLYALACREGKPLSVAILDIDFFKSVNDRFGHAVGDDVLRGIGPLLGGAFRAEDIVSRWGGEEFLVGLYGCAREDAIARIEAATAEARARRFTAPDGTSFGVTFSAGVGTYATDALDLSALIQAADEALYRAKAIGRDRVLPAAPLQFPVGADHLQPLSGAR